MLSPTTILFRNPRGSKFVIIFKICLLVGSLSVRFISRNFLKTELKSENVSSGVPVYHKISFWYNQNRQFQSLWYNFCWKFCHDLFGIANPIANFKSSFAVNLDYLLNKIKSLFFAVYMHRSIWRIHNIVSQNQILYILNVQFFFLQQDILTHRYSPIRKLFGSSST